MITHGPTPLAPSSKTLLLDDAHWEIATTNALLTELKLSTDLRDRVKPLLEAMSHNGTASLATLRAASHLTKMEVIRR